MNRVRLAAVGSILLLGLLLPLRGFAQQSAAPAKSVVSSPGIDRGYITPGAVLVAVVRPRQVLQAREMELMPVEVISAAGMKELGLDPVLIEEVIVIVEMPDAKKPPQAGIVVRYAEPLPSDGLVPDLVERTVKAELSGRPYRRANDPMDLSLMRADERTLLLAHDDLLRRMVANHAKPTAGAACRMLDRVVGRPSGVAVLAMDALRPLIAAEIRKAAVPPMLSGFTKIPDLIVSVEAKLDLLGDQSMSLTLRARDEAAAGQLEAMINALLDMSTMMAREGIHQQMGRSKDPVEQAGAKYANRVLGRVIDLLRPVRKGDSLTLSGRGLAQAHSTIATTGIMVGLLLPAVQAARESARRASSANNMKQIALAMHNYASAFASLPPRANFDKQGKPLLSWRVHLLPYFDAEALYKQFHLDEPWDSPHNRPLISQMPAVYKNPSSMAKAGMTTYLAVCGKGLMFDGNQGRKFADIRDGTSNTIMVVEANDDRAVPWTKPDDWQPDASQPLAGVGRAHPGGFEVAFADGSVRLIAKSIDPTMFYKMLTIAGGEPVKAP